MFALPFLFSLIAFSNAAPSDNVYDRALALVQKLISDQCVDDKKPCVPCGVCDGGATDTNNAKWCARYGKLHWNTKHFEKKEGGDYSCHDGDDKQDCWGPCPRKYTKPLVWDKNTRDILRASKCDGSCKGKTNAANNNRCSSELELLVTRVWALRETLWEYFSNEQTKKCSGRALSAANTCPTTPPEMCQKERHLLLDQLAIPYKTVPTGDAALCSLSTGSKLLGTATAPSVCKLCEDAAAAHKSYTTAKGKSDAKLKEWNTATTSQPAGDASLATQISQLCDTMGILEGLRAKKIAVKVLRKQDRHKSGLSLKLSEAEFNASHEDEKEKMGKKFRDDNAMWGAEQKRWCSSDTFTVVKCGTGLCLEGKKGAFKAFKQTVTDCTDTTERHKDDKFLTLGCYLKDALKPDYPPPTPTPGLHCKSAFGCCPAKSLKGGAHPKDDHQGANCGGCRETATAFLETSAEVSVDSEVPRVADVSIDVSTDLPRELEEAKIELPEHLAGVEELDEKQLQAIVAHLQSLELPSSVEPLFLELHSQMSKEAKTDEEKKHLIEGHDYNTHRQKTLKIKKLLYHIEFEVRHEIKQVIMQLNKKLAAQFLKNLQILIEARTGYYAVNKEYHSAITALNNANAAVSREQNENCKRHDKAKAAQAKIAELVRQIDGTGDGTVKQKLESCIKTTRGEGSDTDDECKVLGDIKNLLEETKEEANLGLLVNCDMTSAEKFDLTECKKLQGAGTVPTKYDDANTGCGKQTYPKSWMTQSTRITVDMSTPNTKNTKAGLYFRVDFRTQIKSGLGGRLFKIEATHTEGTATRKEFWEGPELDSVTAGATCKEDNWVVYFPRKSGSTKLSLLFTVAGTGTASGDFGMELFTVRYVKPIAEPRLESNKPMKWDADGRDKVRGIPSQLKVQYGGGNNRQKSGYVPTYDKCGKTWLLGGKSVLTQSSYLVLNMADAVGTSSTFKAVVTAQLHWFGKAAGAAEKFELGVAAKTTFTGITAAAATALNKGAGVYAPLRATSRSKTSHGCPLIYMTSSFEVPSAKPVLVLSSKTAGSWGLKSIFVTLTPKTACTSGTDNNDCAANADCKGHACGKNNAGVCDGASKTCHPCKKADGTCYDNDACVGIACGPGKVCQKKAVLTGTTVTGSKIQCESCAMPQPGKHSCLQAKACANTPCNLKKVSTPVELGSPQTMTYKGQCKGTDDNLECKETCSNCKIGGTSGGKQCEGQKCNTKKSFFQTVCSSAGGCGDGGGAKPCNCVGANSEADDCDFDTGVCKCKPGFFGRRCENACGTNCGGGLAGSVKCAEDFRLCASGVCYQATTFGKSQCVSTKCGDKKEVDCGVGTCINYFWDTTNKKCVACHEKCRGCTGPKDSQCKACAPGHVKEGAVCEKCASPSCDECKKAGAAGDAAKANRKCLSCAAAHLFTPTTGGGGTGTCKSCSSVGTTTISSTECGKYPCSLTHEFASAKCQACVSERTCSAHCKGLGFFTPSKGAKKDHCITCRGAKVSADGCNTHCTGGSTAVRFKYYTKGDTCLACYLGYPGRNSCEDNDLCDGAKCYVKHHSEPSKPLPGKCRKDKTGKTTHHVYHCVADGR